MPSKLSFKKFCAFLKVNNYEILTIFYLQNEKKNIIGVECINFLHINPVYVYISPYIFDMIFKEEDSGELKTREVSETINNSSEFIEVFELEDKDIAIVTERNIQFCMSGKPKKCYRFSNSLLEKTIKKSKDVEELTIEKLQQQLEDSTEESFELKDEEAECQNYSEESPIFKTFDILKSSLCIYPAYSIKYFHLNIAKISQQSQQDYLDIEGIQETSISSKVKETYAKISSSIKKFKKFIGQSDIEMNLLKHKKQKFQDIFDAAVRKSNQEIISESRSSIFGIDSKLILCREKKRKLVTDFSEIVSYLLEIE